jgi:6,7-dimethyl-8-ribityllumazine synthase
MSEHTEEPEDWPLRDWSTRLRPPGRVEPADDEPEADELEADEPEAIEAAVETDDESLPVDSEAEILFDEDAAGAQPAAVAVEEHAVAVEEHAEGELRIPDGYSVLEGSPTGHRRAVAIVVSRFNAEITNRLLGAALAELDEAGVAQDAILVMPVPGAFELPIAAMALAKTRRYSCVIALGCVIRGETPHFDFVAGEAASGLQLAGIETGVPVSFGVLTCDTAEQAEARIDRGAWAVRSALEMADAFAQLRTAAAR